MVQKSFGNPSRHVATTRIMRGLPQRSRSGNTTRSNKKQPSSETTTVLVSSNDPHHPHHNHAGGAGTGVSGTEWDIYSYNGESVNKDAGSSIIFMGDDWSLPTGISPAPREDHPLDASTIAESDIYTSYYDCYDDEEDGVGGEEEKDETEERQNNSVASASGRETIPLNISFTYSVEEDQEYDNTSYYNNNKDVDGEECRGYEKQEEKYDTSVTAKTTELFREAHFDVRMDLDKMFDITLGNNAKVEIEQQGVRDVVVVDRQSSNVAKAATEDSAILLVEEKEEEWVTKTIVGAESIANHGGGGTNSSTQEGLVRDTVVGMGSKQEEEDVDGVSTVENLVQEGTWIRGGGASEQPSTLEEDEVSV